VINAMRHRPGRNEPCWCGSGRKYKVCHLQEDDAKDQTLREQARAADEEEQGKHADHRCAPYRPQTHKIPATERADFVVAVRNLASAGQGAWLHIDGPVDLGRDQPSVDAAIDFLRQYGVLPDFLLDPSPPVVAATQELLDRMSGRGVFRVEPSGVRLRRYGRTEIVAGPEGGGFVAYLSGRGSLQGVVHLLLDAAAADARTLGVTGGLLAGVWPIARVAREIVVNRLALPEPLLERPTELAGALVDLISRAADMLDHNGASAEAVRAQAALPYLVGLREAVSDPEGQLEGMGLEAESVKILSVQLEQAADGPRWLHQLADLAGDGWDTPDGYRAWRDAARSVLEVSDVLTALPQRAATPSEVSATGAAVVGLVTTEGTPVAVTTPGPDMALPASLSADSQVAALPLPAPLTAFADVDLAAQEYATRRQVVRDRLAEILDRREELVRRRLELETNLRDLIAEEAGIDEQQASATEELEAHAEAEAHSRHETIMAVLALGAARLGEAAAAWSQALLVSKERRDDATLEHAERTVREYEDMEKRGLIEQLPAGVRSHIRQEVEEARTSLRDVLGGRDPLTVPAVVAAVEEDPGLTLSVGLPLTGGDDLAPGALQTAVAVAVADVLAETARSMPQINVVAVDHDRCPRGGSVLRLRFSGPPPVTADDCAQYCASLLTDVGRRSAPLRAAGVSIEARVEPDLNVEASDG
jgi:hypothetical protein